MISVEALRIEYGRGRRRTLAVAEVTFQVADGEFVSLIGPSGCGKTSVLLAIDGIIRPTSGRITIRGEDVRGVRRDVAFITQDAGLLPWKTVRQNAELALRLQRRPREGVQEILRSLGLGGFENRYPAELSEGMRRRVGIARALALRPEVFLMDEPMANLDTLTRERIQEIILRLWHMYRFTGVLVTHDIEEAVFLGQRIIILSPRPARVVEVIENPGMGEVGYRRSEEFYHVVVKAREILKSLEER
jgi:NitT/TauT family transport system ATP-binding protein